jgi:hypothetical protein
MVKAPRDQPADMSAACIEAMERLEGQTFDYVPPWERRDQSEPWLHFEPGSHVVVRVGGRFFESDGSGSIHRVS